MGECFNTSSPFAQLFSLSTHSECSSPHCALLLFLSRTRSLQLGGGATEAVEHRV